MAAQLFTAPSRALDSNGAPYAGAIWSFYATGTTTPQQVFADSALSVSLGSTVTADSGGKFPAIYFDPAKTYRGVLKDASAATTIYDIDPINYPGGAGFFSGRPAAVAGSLSKVNWNIEAAGTAHPTDGLGGLWSDKVTWDHAISADFTAENSPVNTPLASPASALMVAAHNVSSDATVCSLQAIAGVHASNKEASGVNFITYSGEGLTGVKLKGLEIDIQPHSTSTISEAFGLALNAFTKEVPGNAIYIEGIFGGYFTSGIRIGKLNSSTGAGIYGGNGATMGALVHSSEGTYGEDAIVLSNGHKIRRKGTGTVHAKDYMDGSNIWRFVLGDGVMAIRDKTDTSTLISFDTGGNVNLESGGTLLFTNAVSTSSATAGANTLPSNPVGFLTVNIGGTNRKIPYYA